MERSSGYRADIDGLRAVAVLLVVLYHIGVPGVSGGFIGVDVFFVISGFLISSLLVAEAEARGRVDLSNFFARRIRRLFPALMTVVLATLLIGAVWLMPVFSEQTNLAKSAIATATYLSNFYFWDFTGNYFAGPAELAPLLHTWSLAVEEQFYLVWPFLIIAVLAVSNRSKNDLRRSLFYVLIPLSLFSLGFCLWRTESDPGAAYFLMPSRAWEFAIGALLAVTIPKANGRLPVNAGALSAAGLLMIIVSAFCLDEASAFPGYVALFPTLGCAAVIAGGAVSQNTAAGRLLTLKPMVLVGLLSYSWYLWHWPLLAIARANSLHPNLARDALLGMVSLVAAWLTYRYIETPIRHKRPGPFAAIKPTLWAGVSMSVLLVGAGGALGESANLIGNGAPQYAATVFAKHDKPPLRSTCHQEEPFEGLAPQNECTFGRPDKIEAVLWGDSHADHVSALIQAFATERGLDAGGILQRTFSSCRPLESGAATVMRMNDDCVEFNAAVVREITELEAAGLNGIVLSAMWTAVFGETRGPLSRREKVEYASKAVDTVVSMLVSHGLKVLIIGPTVVMPHSVPECVARHGAAACSIPREVVEKSRKPIVTALNRIAGDHDAMVRIWDPIDQLCNERLCFATHGGTVMYTDDDHLSASAARSFLDSARGSLEWLVKDTEG